MTPESFDKLVKLIAPQEGYRQYPYYDTEHKVTIGYGLNLTALGMDMEQAKATYPHGISEEAARENLIDLLNKLIKDLGRYYSFFNQLDDVRQAVLVDMAYNMGMKGLIDFHHMLLAIKDGDYNYASADLLDSLAAHQLPTRYHVLALMLKSGEWPANV